MQSEAIVRSFAIHSSVATRKTYQDHFRPNGEMGEIGVPPVLIHFHGTFHYKPTILGVAKYGELPPGRIDHLQGRNRQLEAGDWYMQ